MISKNTSVKILNADIDSVASTVGQFLSKRNFIKDESLSKKNLIVTENSKKSFLKLFFSGAPQIVRFRLGEMPGEKVRLEISFDYFRKFQILLYSITVFFLLLSAIFNYLYIVAMKSQPIALHNHAEFKEILSAEAYLILMGLSLLITFFILLYRLGSESHGKYLSDLNEYFESEFIVTDYQKQEAQISGKSLVFFSFIALLAMMVICIDQNTFKALTVSWWSSTLFIHILFSMAGILCVLLLFFYIDPTSSAKTLFLAPGIILALNFFCYLNVPSFNSDIGLDFSEFNSKRDMAMQEIIRGEGDVEQQRKTVKKADFLAKVFVLMYMGAFLVIALAVLAVDIVFISIPVIIAKHINKYPLDSPESIYHKALDHGPLSNSYNYIVMTLWGILLSGNLLGLYVACSLAEWLFFGTNKYISSDISSKFIDDVSFFSKLFFDQGQSGTRIFLCLYLIPILLILAFSFVRHSKNICRRTKWLLHNDVDPHITQIMNEIILPICRYADISPPTIRISNSGRSTYAESLFAGFPVFRNVLIISRKTYDASLIDKGRTEALFAHEIGHMRQHTFIHRIQCVLSDISFVGTGFLSIMSSSFKIEYEADRFAVEYLKSRNTDPSCLIGLLEEIRNIERSESIKKALEINTAGSLNFGMARNADYRERLMAVYGKSSFLNRFIISFKLFCQMCFGQEVLSYFHPPVDERIKRIKREYYGT